MIIIRNIEIRDGILSITASSLVEAGTCKMIHLDSGKHYIRANCVTTCTAGVTMLPLP